MCRKFKSVLFSLFLIIPLDLIAAENVLKIAGWDAYADPQNPHKTIGYQSFEEKFGIRIEFTPLSNLDDIVEAAESSKEYDVYIVSNEGISILYGMGLVRALKLNKLPAYQSLHHNLKYSPWSQFESQIYAVPWAWGPTGLMYNTDIVSSPNSWGILWDKQYEGKVAMWDDVSMIWTTALYLGYKNVYSLTKVQLEQVKQKLLEFNSLPGHYYKGGGDEIEWAKKGKIVLYNSWFDPSARLKAAGKNFEMIIPKEGAVGMFDSYLLSNNCSQANIAHQYINHQITPEVQFQMVRATGLSPANIETLSLLQQEEIRALHLDDIEYFGKMLLWDNMPRKHLYEKVLEEVRADYKRKSKARK